MEPDEIIMQLVVDILGFTKRSVIDYFSAREAPVLSESENDKSTPEEKVKIRQNMLEDKILDPEKYAGRQYTTFHLILNSKLRTYIF